MKQLILTTHLFLLVTLCQAQTKNFLDQPYMEVSGSADTLVIPNQIYIRILLSEKETKDRTSIEELENRMVVALKSLGINTEIDLTTKDIISNFQSYFLRGKDVVKSKSYILKVGDAVMATKVFTTLEELGIANASIDRVDHSNLEGIRNLMRTEAVLDAKARAIALTKPLNQTIGVAIYIADTESPSNMLQGKVAGVVIRGYSSIRQETPEPAQIEFEKIKVEATVNVKFMLR